jgi:hypothetical protein
MTAPRRLTLSAVMLKREIVLAQAVLGPDHAGPGGRLA